MLITVKWLEELLGKKLEVERLKRISLNLGLEVEEVTSLAPPDLRIGRIERLTPHPTLGNLTILQVKLNKRLQIVTAAKNVKKGDLVLVGPAGIKFNEQTIKEKNFKGVKSEGVLISEQELGLAESSTGVIILERGKPGALFKDFFDDLVLDMSTTPNRPDWLSVEGIAREMAVGLNINKAVRPAADRLLYASKQTNRRGSFKIEIKNLTGCPRYTARIFNNVEVKESPFWMKWRLHCMGMSHVNNIVDITNIIMLLTGQPLHPFDLDLLKGGIIIRKAKSGEEFTTLEGTKLTLTRDDLIIADDNGPIALAGIIGARCAQITENTKRVLLESAYFDPKYIAHTSRRLGLITEASIRFERGADISAVDKASLRSGELFKRYASAKEQEFLGEGEKGKAVRIKFSLDRLNKILSLALTSDQVKSLLKKIDIQVSGRGKLLARIPHYRRDLRIEEDIYEEVARVFGYMKIPETMPQRWGGRVKIDRMRMYENNVKNYLLGQGYSEAYTLSLTASSRLLKSGFDKFVTIKNPLNERFDALRPTLFFGLLDCVNYNLSKGNRSLRFFEIGNILLPEDPFQERRLGLIVGGEQYPDFWNKRGEVIDYYDAKGIVESIFKLLHIKEIQFTEVTKRGFSQAAAVQLAGKELGFVGCIESTLCKSPYYYAELHLEKILKLITETYYIPPAKYPANTRDLSFLVDIGVEVPRLIEMITEVGGPILEKVILFDYYKGKNLPADKKNLGFRLYFRSPDRTLTDSEVDAFVKRIEEKLSKKVDAKLRKKE
ncbi:MAG TPA: phenylalanine--tRNA ligase subunit beta [candidate division WOR-3 bacterium]|uniref:Phenylalanine--tRNA ligase beta subunit n=1 Tax=candidate division WOR-3 bacterium TaxID=2052148 RepID=A0A9C9K0K0_UNCW3|nr:phenylalanine--tRNA ligase subunit beta [candidate division WOR-3 bacterium]